MLLCLPSMWIFTDQLCFLMVLCKMSPSYWQNLTWHNLFIVPEEVMICDIQPLKGNKFCLVFFMHEWTLTHTHFLHFPFKPSWLTEPITASVFVKLCGPWAKSHTSLYHLQPTPGSLWHDRFGVPSASDWQLPDTPDYDNCAGREGATSCQAHKYSAEMGSWNGYRGHVSW